MAEMENFFDNDGSCVPDIANLNETTLGAGQWFVPPDLSAELIKLIRDGGCVEGMARHMPMKRETLLVRKFATGVDGYWVGAQCVKQKDAPTFDAVELIAKKMAVIVPFEDQLIEDMDIDLVAQVNADVTAAFVEAIDRTFLGYEITSPFSDSWSGNVPNANIVPLGTEGPDLAGDISLAISDVESNGYEVTGMVTHPRIKGLLRNLRDGQNNFIYTQDLSSCSPQGQYCVFGIPICFTRQVAEQGSPDGYEILMGQTDQLIVGDRTGIQVSSSNAATLTQASMDDINLFEQDMTAYRYVIRKAFMVLSDNALAKVTGVGS